jgi:nicotinamide mononucleotide transporter
MTTIEIIATVFGLTCVWLTVRQNIWCWPAGLIQVVLYIWIFQQAMLYSDMGLHVIYVGLSLYGWWYWLKNRPQGCHAPVFLLDQVQRIIWITVGFLGTLVLGYVMETYTDAALPYWDAATTILSLIAQYLMARKRLESWLFWIAVDVMAIGVYITKTLYVTSGLYSVFLILAVIGLFAWRKTMTQPIPQTVAQPASTMCKASRIVVLPDSLLPTANKSPRIGIS